jgi:hypothetical protein
MDTVHTTNQPANPSSLQPVVPMPTIVTPPPKMGRPTKLDQITVTKLIAAFQRGHTDTKACEYARIARQTFYRNLKDDPDFRDKITDAKNFWVMAAGDHITDLIKEKTNDPQIRRLQVKTSQWILEKHEPEIYANKVDPAANINNTQNNYLFITNEQLKQLASNSNITNADPAALVTALTPEHMARGAAEGSAVAVHQEPSGTDDTSQVSVQGP